MEIEVQIINKTERALEKTSRRVLPAFAHKFLFTEPREFPVARFFVGAVFGALSGAGLFLGLMNNIPMTVVSRLISAYVFVGLCILGGAFSSYFRCSVLLMIPCMLNSQGRAYVMLFVLYGLYQGPISNIYRNVQDVSLSIGCNIDLQIEQSKIMWRAVIDPFMEVLQEVVNERDVLLAEAKNVSMNFQGIRDEMMGDYGYDPLNKEPSMAKNSTQEMFIAKTMMRCDYVVEQGINRCKEWFSLKWQECMDVIKVPLINHVLCVLMQFDFLCDIMRIMTPWCKEEIPVGGNFGDAYDKLNDSINNLANDFTANVAYKRTEKTSLLGDRFSQEEYTEQLREALEEKMVIVDQLLEIFQIVLSCTFVFVFLSAFGYIRQYNQDICFDNMYITTYFRQIDARRKKIGKRYLLPLKKVEQPKFIYPWSLRIHPCELKCMLTGLLKVVSLVFCIGLLLAIDWILYHIFSIVCRHILMEYTVSSTQQFEITVGGHSMLAKLLQRTVRAFNRSSRFDLKSTNRNCLPQPRALSQEDYLWVLIPLVMMTIMCCLQVYTSRLRRVIAAFYFPKREKRRTLFLYNLQIQKRISYVDKLRKRLMRQGRPQKTVFLVLLSLFEKLGLKLQWCCACGDRQTGGRVVQCPVSMCRAVYCPQCWNDLGRFCFACSPCSVSSLDDHSDLSVTMQNAEHTLSSGKFKRH
ncbi:DC-STAMP domain-containing protein 1 [Arapaima gigas]